MTRVTRGLLTAAILIIGAACGPAAGPGIPASPRSQTSVVTFEEIQQRGQYSNLYVLLQDLRPRWLRAQGPDSFMGSGGAVQVVMDGNRMGSVDALKSLSPSGVTSIRFVAPIEAAAQYGLDYSHGAVVISTAPVH
jgi:hypothetical protein